MDASGGAQEAQVMKQVSMLVNARRRLKGNLSKMWEIRCFIMHADAAQLSQIQQEMTVAFLQEFYQVGKASVPAHSIFILKVPFWGILI